MDYTEYTSLRNKLGASPNLCTLFKLLSVETWKRIEYAYLRSGIKVFETTITQNLIFSINAYNDQYGLNIEIFEAANENANGNDFELIIRYPSEGVEFYAPVQAKKIYRNGRYLSMDHGDQIESLIKYASGKKANPFYLLYNFSQTPIMSVAGLVTPVESIGCTLIPADYLFNNYYKKKTRRKRDGTVEAIWQIPNFFDLNPNPAFPWHEIVCPGNAGGLYKHLQKIGLIATSDSPKTDDLVKLDQLGPSFYPINTFKKDNSWIDIKEITFQDRYSDGEIRRGRSSIYEEDLVPDPKRIKGQEERVYPRFAPKSRIVLSQKLN